MFGLMDLMGLPKAGLYDMFMGKSGGTPFKPANPEQASWGAGTSVTPKGAFMSVGLDGGFKGLTDKGKEALTGATGAFSDMAKKMEPVAMQAADPHSDPTNAQYWAQIQAQRQKQIPRKTGSWI